MVRWTQSVIAFAASIALAPTGAGAGLEPVSSPASAWGLDAYGQSDVPDLEPGVRAIAAGRYHSLAVTRDGRVIAWGENSSGQTEVPVAAQTGAIDAAGGIYHSLVLTRDGEVIAWGDNKWEQSSVPAAARSGTVAVAASGTGSVALNKNGEVIVWGNLDSKVPGDLASRVVAISGGDTEALALTEDGGVVAWNAAGPVQVPEQAQAGIRAISAGAFHALALTDDGEVIAWGDNSRGQAEVPPEAKAGVAAVAAGGYGSLALLESGQVIAWGDDRFGQLAIPPEASSGVAAVARGSLHAIASRPRADRIEGADRFQTSVSVSKTAYPTGGVPAVFIANGYQFPDSLSAGPAAARMGGPLLLTPPNELPEVIAAEIQRLRPNTIVIVGGPNAVSVSVANEVKSLAPVTLRVGGADRYETSREIASFAFDGQEPQEAVVATGASYPDALSAGAAIGERGPVILVDGATAHLDAGTGDLLSDLGVKRAWVAGGPAAVSEGVRADLERQALSGTRLAGADRFATAQAINWQFHRYQRGNRTFVASGANFPDALVGSTLAAAERAPLALAPMDCLPAEVLIDSRKQQSSQFTLLGGPSVLSNELEKLTVCPSPTGAL
jgi:putative cell wall-binding protein